MAAYVLGFINSIQAGPVVVPDGAGILKDLPFLFISVTFAYATAVLYVNYHAALLTMPTMPLERLQWDFGLALFEAVAFGVSIRYPGLFTGALGLTFLVASWRQSTEHRVLTRQFALRFVPSQQTSTMRQDKDKEKARAEFEKLFAKLLQCEKFKELSAWNRASVAWHGAALFGLFLSAAFYAPSIGPYLQKPAGVACATVVSGSIVILLSFGTLSRRAKFLFKEKHEEIVRMDSEFKDLLGICEGGSASVREFLKANKATN